MSLNEVEPIQIVRIYIIKVDSLKGFQFLNPKKNFYV